MVSQATFPTSGTHLRWHHNKQSLWRNNVSSGWGMTTFVDTWISSVIRGTVVPRGGCTTTTLPYSIYNIPALVQIMAWCLPGDKPLSEPMVVSLPMHICITRPQWVKRWALGVVGCLVWDFWRKFTVITAFYSTEESSALEGAVLLS